MTNFPSFLFFVILFVQDEVNTTIISPKNNNIKLFFTLFILKPHYKFIT